MKVTMAVPSVRLRAGADRRYSKDSMDDGGITERHGREPTSRGRYEGRAARATTAGRPVGWGGNRDRMSLLRGAVGAKDVFLRNEPTVFHQNLLCNLRCMRGLWLKFIEEFGGFVFQNEPTGGGF